MQNNQRGFAHVLVVIVLLAGLAASVYLVQQRTNFLPHAESRPISNPITPTPTLPVSRPITPPKNCPLLAPIKCPEGTRPVSQGNDSKGCPLPPKCEKVSCSACTADVAKSGSVDIMDFSKFRMCFGKSATEVDSAGTSCALSDFDQDGSVTLSDFNCLREVFGQQCSEPQPTSMPVPTATPTPTPTLKPTATPTPVRIVGNRVFITEVQNANLGGLAMADALCRSRAEGNGLWKNGTYWLAWLSDNSTSVASRFIHSTEPYVLLNGVKIADNWNDLTDGTLQHAININASNQEVSGVPVWTGTKPDGQIARPFGYTGAYWHCDNWTQWRQGYARGASGSSSKVDQGWSWPGGAEDCSRQPSYIYCFEQVTGQGSVNTTSGANVAKSNSKIPASLACTPCQADINKDGTVSISDFSKLSGCYNKSASGNCAGVDINGDGKINTDDLSCLMSQFGKKCK